MEKCPKLGSAIEGCHRDLGSTWSRRGAGTRAWHQNCHCYDEAMSAYSVGAVGRGLPRLRVLGISKCNCQEASIFWPRSVKWDGRYILLVTYAGTCVGKGNVLVCRF